MKDKQGRTSFGLMVLLGIAVFVLLGLQQWGLQGLATRIALFINRTTQSIGQLVQPEKVDVTTEQTAEKVTFYVQSLNRIETTKMTISDQQITINRRGRDFLPDWIDGESMTLVAHGEVIAGVDMTKIMPESIKFEDKILTIVLPPTQLLTWRLDNQATRVFYRTQGIFRNADINLESTLREIAEYNIVSAACDAEILNQATLDAQNSIEYLVKTFNEEQSEPLIETLTIVPSQPDTTQCQEIKQSLNDAINSDL